MHIHTVELLSIKVRRNNECVYVWSWVASREISLKMFISAVASWSSSSGSITLSQEFPPRRFILQNEGEKSARYLDNTRENEVNFK